MTIKRTIIETHYQFKFDEFKRLLGIPEDEAIDDIETNNLYGYDVVTKK